MRTKTLRNAKLIVKIISNKITNKIITESVYDNTYERYYAWELANALREFAEKPQNIDNFESYLKYCFIGWKENFANTPEKMIEDMKHFAEMEV